MPERVPIRKDAGSEVSKLPIEEISPESLKQESDKQLLSLHLRLHQLFAANFADNGKITVGDLNRETLVNAEIFVQEELARRKLDHEVEDELTAEAARLRQAKSVVEKRERNPIKILVDVGPPNEWSGSVAACLGPALRKELQRVWDQLPKEEKKEIKQRFAENFEKRGIVKPFASPGGKEAQRAVIVGRIPDHKVYVEPYAGSATIFWARKQRSEKEVLADADPAIVEVYAFLRDAPDKDLAWLRQQSWGWSEVLFDKLKKVAPTTARARVYRFKYLNLFSVRGDGQRFNRTDRARTTHTGKNFLAHLEKFRDRLKGVEIHQGDALKTVAKYDGPDTFFYLDPPWKAAGEGEYWKTFDVAAFEKAISQIRGKAILSYQGDLDPGPAWQMITVRAAMGGSTGESTQTLLANFKLEKRETALTRNSGEVMGDTIKVEDVLPHFQDFVVRTPLVYLVGGLANHGETKNDIDILLRGPLGDELRHVIQFRLGRMLPPDLSRRVQFLDEDLGGPFSDHYELADLIVRFRPAPERKEMRAPTLKQDDPYLQFPKSPGPKRAVLQYHFRGKSNHADLRMQLGDFLIGWTMAVQREGAIAKPVDTLAAARDIARSFSVEGDRFAKPILAPAKVFATQKLRQPLSWLDVNGEVIGEGEVGATRQEKGVILALDHPSVEYGLQKLDSHEYFFSKGKHLNGIMFYRLLAGRAGASAADVGAGRASKPGQPFWVGFLSKNQLPSVLGSRAVRTKSMPPDGVSALPMSLQREVPREFQYWKAKGKKAMEIRNALVKERIFTESTVAIVNREFRLIRRKMFLADAQGAVRKSRAVEGTPLQQAAQLLPSCDPPPFLLDPTISSKLRADELVEKVRKIDRHYLVAWPDSPFAREMLSELGRPFLLKNGDPGTVFVASCPLERIDRVEFLDIPFEEEVERMQNATDSASPRDEPPKNDKLDKLKVLYEKVFKTVIPVFVDKQKSAEERFVLGIVLEPDEPDSQDDTYSAEEIRKACHGFMEYHGNRGIMHSELANEKSVILECYLAPVAFEMKDFRGRAREVKEGAWLLGQRVLDDDLWGEVKTGEIGGYSIGGTAVRRPRKEKTAEA